MRTASQTTLPTVDWSAINRRLTPRERVAFNRFHARLRNLVRDLVEEIEWTHDLAMPMRPEFVAMARRLAELTLDVPTLEGRKGDR